MTMLWLMENSFFDHPKLRTVRIEIFFAKLHDKEKYKRNLKQALNYGSGLRNCIN